MSNLMNNLAEKANSVTTQTEKPKTTPSEQIQITLKKMEREIAKALPKHMTAEHFSRVVLTAVKSSPKLLTIMEKNPQSLLGSIMLSAQLGLDLTPSLGQGYLIPYGNDCQFQIGYRGLMNLVRRSGEITSIETNIVYENDEFELDLSPINPVFRHKPLLKGDRGEAYMCYCVARFKDGGHHLEWMTKSEIYKIREKSKAKSSGYKTPWDTDEEEMWKKTVIKRACKRLPISVDILKSVHSEDTIKTEIAENMLDADGISIYDVNYSTDDTTEASL